MSSLITIGALSQISRLTVKALRLYHEQGILLPAHIDPDSGYRYYDATAIRRGKAIKRLKKLGFTLEQTAKILASCGDDGDMTPFLEERLSQVHQEISHQRKIAEEIQIILEGERKEAMSEQFDVVEKELEPLLICGIRFTGTYDAIGKRFSTLYKHAARYTTGKPMGLYYDQEYREDDADIEAAVPVKKKVDLPGISCRELPGGRFVSTVHPGPYDQIGDSLSKLMEYCQKKNLAFTGPHREVYLKGPGMILPRNPKNYLTEVLLPVESDRG